MMCLFDIPLQYNTRIVR